MPPHCLAAPDDAKTTTGRVGGAGRYNPRYRPAPPPCRTPPGRRRHPPL